MRRRARVAGWAVLAALVASAAGCGSSKTDEQTNPEFKIPDQPATRGGPPLDPKAATKKP